MIDIDAEVERVVTQKNVVAMIKKVNHFFDEYGREGTEFGCIIELKNGYKFYGCSSSKGGAYDLAVLHATEAIRFAHWDKLVKLKELGVNSL